MYFDVHMGFPSKRREWLAVSRIKALLKTAKLRNGVLSVTTPQDESRLSHLRVEAYIQAPSDLLNKKLEEGRIQIAEVLGTRWLEAHWGTQWVSY